MKALTMVGMMLFALVSGSAHAEETTKRPQPGKTRSMQMTPEQRQNMAAAHDKMAACLRSEKPMTECRSEMMKSCKDMMGQGGCPMMGHMSGMMGEEKPRR